MHRIIMCAPALCALLAAASFAAEAKQKPIPAGGTPMLAKDALFSDAVKAVGIKEYGKLETVKVEQMPFDKAVRVSVTKAPVKTYHVQLKFLDLPAFKAKEAMLLSFYARSVGAGNNDTGEGAISATLQARDTNKAIESFNATPGSNWQQYFVRVNPASDFAAGKTSLAFSFGQQVQSIEIGGLAFTNYGDKVDVKDLPETVFTYAGREADAPWRKAALERIEKIRKGDITVVVKDAAGKPVADADVKIEMKRHAFLFGSAVTARAFEKSEAAAPILPAHKKFFNMGVSIGDFLWKTQESQEGQFTTERLQKFFEENHFYVRGHVLVWERDDHFPDDVVEMINNNDKDKLRQRVGEHVTKIVSQFKGRVNEWVVENEAVDNSRIRDVLGHESIAEWFKLARAADPAARLMINENRVDGLKPDKSDRLLELVKIIGSNGGKVDAIGIQGHFGSVAVPPTTLLQYYDKLAATGKALAITEYDFNTADAEMKGDYTRDIMTLVFSHPSFYNFTIWRMWDGKPEKREGVMFSNDWKMKPSGRAYEDLVFNQWWTRADGKTDASGTFKTRGFYGDYEITASRGGKTQKVTASLLKDQPGTIEIKLGE